MTDYQRQRILNRRDYARRPNSTMRRGRNDYSDYEDEMRRSKHSTRYSKPRYEEDYYDDSRMSYMDDEQDYGEYDYADSYRLSKRDIMDWKRDIINADGSKGEHFKFDLIMKAAKDMGIRFHEYDEKELCLTVNMLYSDYCEVLKPFISPDKELYVYVALGKAFLEDEDAPEGSEKLARYYHYVVNAE